MATIVVCAGLLIYSIRKALEDEIGSQMAVQAEIAAHLVKVANLKKPNGMTDNEINTELQDIVFSVKRRGELRKRDLEYEFWITGQNRNDGKATLHAWTARDDNTGLPKEPPVFDFLEEARSRIDSRDEAPQASDGDPEQAKGPIGGRLARRWLGT
jgi:hypothetical protein